MHYFYGFSHVSCTNALTKNVLFSTLCGRTY